MTGFVLHNQSNPKVFHKFIIKSQSLYGMPCFWLYEDEHHVPKHPKQSIALFPLLIILIPILQFLNLPQLSWCSQLSSGFNMAAAKKLLKHGEQRKKRASLAWVEMPFLSLPLSPHSTCSLSRWDQEGGAVEGKRRVQHKHARSRKRGRWGCREEMGRKRAVHGRYQPNP